MAEHSARGFLERMQIEQGPTAAQVAEHNEDMKRIADRLAAEQAAKKED